MTYNENDHIQYKEMMTAAIIVMNVNENMKAMQGRRRH